MGTSRHKTQCQWCHRRIGFGSSETRRSQELLHAVYISETGTFQKEASAVKTNSHAPTCWSQSMNSEEVFSLRLAFHALALNAGQ